MSIASRIRNAPQVFRLSVRSQPERGGPVGPTVVDRDGLKTSGARHILIFVHGFNNKESEATASYTGFFGMIAADLTKSTVAPDAVAQFHWPGNLAVSPFSWTDAIGYPDDIPQAIASAGRLADYLAAFPRPGGDVRSLKVSFVGHSLGCRLILEMLTKLQPAQRPDLGFVGLMAAAAGVQMGAPGSAFVSAAQDVRSLVKFWSTRDPVLHYAFPSGQATAYALGIETVLYMEAIGRNGNPASFRDGHKTNNRHGEYWPDPRIAELIVPMIDASLRRVLPQPLGIPANILPTRATPPPRGIRTRSLRS